MALSASKSLPLLFIAAAAVCVRLGFWQLGRLEERRAANAVALAQHDRPPVGLDAVPLELDSTLVYRHVVGIGRYDFAHELLLRGQGLDGVPGITLLTPLRLEGVGEAVLVERGFVPSPDALTEPAIALPRDTGLVTVRGLALGLSTKEEGQPVTHAGRTSWRQASMAMADSLPYGLRQLFIRPAIEEARARGFPRVLPPPTLDDGPHLSYAFQWFSFAVVALVSAGVLWRRRERVSVPFP